MTKLVTYFIFHIYLGNYLTGIKISKTKFGFKTVNHELKQGLVNNVFASVASKYDIMNDVMSFGMHRLWKKIFIDNIQLIDGIKILDMASGTGDIACKIHEKAVKYGINCDFTLADINANMLKQAQDRIINENLNTECFKFHLINGENTGLEDNHYDYYTIAYGIRNFTDLSRGLSEAYRVLKPGGKFLCLEFSALTDGMLKEAYDFYSFNLIPKFGKIITGDEASYQYFVESIRIFPKPKDFAQMIEDNNFTNVKFQNLFQGLQLYTLQRN